MEKKSKYNVKKYNFPLIMKPAWFVHGSFKTICSYIVDGIHILQIGQSQKRKQINLSFLNQWLFNFFPYYAQGQAFSYAKVVVKIKNGKLYFKWKPWVGSSHTWIFCCIQLHVPAQEEVYFTTSAGGKKVFSLTSYNSANEKLSPPWILTFLQ